METELLNALELSLAIGCSLDCKYCPQELLLRKYYGKDKNRKSKLSFEDFETVLKKVRPGATITFSGMAEPFLNEQCSDMIVYASEQGYGINLFTSLVGMRVEDLDKLRKIPFDHFVLHIPDQEGHSKFHITDEYLITVKKVIDSIPCTYYSCHGTVHKAVRNIVDPKKYAGIHPESRAGNVDCLPKVIPPQGEVVCYLGSEVETGGWTPLMLPDGTLVLCSEDYGMKHVLGNLIDQSWDEIKAGEEYSRFIRGMKDDSNEILCRHCSWALPVDKLPSMRLRKAVEQVKSRNLALESIPSEARETVKRFAAAEHVCVFGLGKVWRNHFLQEYWHKGLNCEFLCDNTLALPGEGIAGLSFVSPDTLLHIKGLLVVIFVKNAKTSVEIQMQLKSMGILNVILYSDLFKAANLLP